MQRFVQPPGARLRRAGQERGGLGQVACLQKDVEAGLGHDLHAHRPSRLVDHFGVAVEHGRPAGVDPGARGRVERSGRVGVVGVEPGQQLAGAAPPTLVDRARLPAVGRALPVIEPRTVAAQHLRGAVGAAPVHHQVFEVGVALRQDGADRLLDERPLIERGRHHRDAWPAARRRYGGHGGRHVRPRPARAAGSRRRQDARFGARHDASAMLSPALGTPPLPRGPSS
jgi:hypothetical protein